MALLKTRNTLIDVARQLFARLGVENVTMNDIASASKRGRRTLYTYFNNKEEIFKAVVETELGNMYAELQQVEEKEISAEKKLLEYIRTRLDAIKNAVFRNGTLKANFFRDIWRVQNVRKSFDRKEIEILKRILQKGVDEGSLEMPDVDMTAEILHHALKGIEVPYIRGLIDSDNVTSKRQHNNIAYLIFQGIKKKKNSILNNE